jgi:hypothetical protein
MLVNSSNKDISSSYSSFEKSIIIERENNAIHHKDRIEHFDDYFPCREEKGVN